MLTVLARLTRENQARMPARLIAWDRQQTLRRQLRARSGQRRTM